jgi:hypothetical protein
VFAAALSALIIFFIGLIPVGAHGKLPFGDVHSRVRGWVQVCAPSCQFNVLKGPVSQAAINDVKINPGGNCANSILYWDFLLLSSDYGENGIVVSRANFGCVGEVGGKYSGISSLTNFTIVAKSARMETRAISPETKDRNRTEVVWVNFWKSSLIKNSEMRTWLTAEIPVTKNNLKWFIGGYGIGNANPSGPTQARPSSFITSSWELMAVA